ncbi:MAG: hypothetical protein NTW52_13455 [Planctomycetota bacterium]|nr:hypothetical protein [Planctomycetota bacterium]
MKSPNGRNPYDLIRNNFDQQNMRQGDASQNDQSLRNPVDGFVMIDSQDVWDRLHGWIYGLLFGLHFAAIGFAWIPLFTKLRELHGQQTAAICGSGPSIAAILTLFLFLAVESRWPRIRRRLWCAGAEAGMAVCYLVAFAILYFLPSYLSGSDSIRVEWILLPMFIVMGLCQASGNALISSMIVASRYHANLPRYRAIGSLGYALVALAMDNLVAPSQGLLFAAATAVVGAIVCGFLPKIKAVATAANTETMLHSNRWNRQLPILVPLLVMLFLTGTSEQFHTLYAHEFAVEHFGTSGTDWIGFAVLIEIVILFIYPANPTGWLASLILVQPLAWLLLYASCTIGVESSAWFAYAILLQGFNCGGVVMVQQRVGRILSDVSAQASILFAQGSGWLMANALDAFVLGEGTSVVWRTALQFSIASFAVALVALVIQWKQTDAK